MAKIYLAGGCFWGVQAYFDRVEGIIQSQVGYANSHIINPSYEVVCSGVSGAAEAVELVYSHITLEEIIERFLSIIDPCALNYQGNDIGTQYRSGIYFLHDKEREIIEKVLCKWEQAHGLKVVTEVLPLINFYPAETYHQQYLAKNPRGYCHIDIESALHNFKMRH